MDNIRNLEYLQCEKCGDTYAAYTNFNLAMCPNCKYIKEVNIDSEDKNQ